MKSLNFFICAFAKDCYYVKKKSTSSFSLLLNDGPFHDQLEHAIPRFSKIPEHFRLLTDRSDL